MPAVSKAQQKFFGIVRAIQKGELEATTPETAKVAATMKKKDVKDFASTDHKGLPEKKLSKEQLNYDSVRNFDADSNDRNGNRNCFDRFGAKMTEESNPRIPRKKGQPANSKKHSDLYTDENPKGTIHGLGFKDVETAKASVSKIRNSSRSHAHKIQAAVAMEQRAREMGKTSEAAVFRKYINSMKKKTEKRKKKKTLKEFMSEAYSQPERQSHKTPKLPVDRKLKIDYGNGKKKYNMPMPRGEYQKPSELTV